jgi:hypothetical protein
MVRASAMSSLSDRRGASVASDTGTMAARAGMLAHIVFRILRAEVCMVNSQQAPSKGEVHA